MAFLLI